MDCIYSSWGRKELDMTKRLSASLFHFHTLGIQYIYIAYILGIHIYIYIYTHIYSVSVYYKIVPLYPQDILSKTFSGCLKSRRVPIPLCVMIFSYMPAPMIKFQL